MTTLKGSHFFYPHFPPLHLPLKLKLILDTEGVIKVRLVEMIYENPRNFTCRMNKPLKKILPSLI